MLTTILLVLIQYCVIYLCFIVIRAIHDYVSRQMRNSRKRLPEKGYYEISFWSELKYKADSWFFILTALKIIVWFIAGNNLSAITLLIALSSHTLLGTLVSYLLHQIQYLQLPKQASVPDFDQTISYRLLPPSKFLPETRRMRILRRLTTTRLAKLLFARPIPQLPEKK